MAISAAFDSISYSSGPISTVTIVISGVTAPISSAAIVISGCADGISKSADVIYRATDDISMCADGISRCADSISGVTDAVSIATDRISGFADEISATKDGFAGCAAMIYGVSVVGQFQKSDSPQRRRVSQRGRGEKHSSLSALTSASLCVSAVNYSFRFQTEPLPQFHSSLESVVMISVKRSTSLRVRSIVRRLSR